MATMAQALKAAKLANPKIAGKLYAESRLDRLTTSEKSAARPRIAEIDAELKSRRAARRIDSKAHAERVLAAARFALDVDGDEPSWSQLAEVVSDSEKYQADLEYDHDLVVERRRLDGSQHGSRCTISEAMSAAGLPMSMVLYFGDSWSDVMSNIPSASPE